jgi:UDP-GlcNAc3NAcA epimerase
MSAVEQVLSVVGARPHFVKAAPLSRALDRAGIAEVLVHTGQHYDRPLSGLLFEQLSLKEPDHHLAIGSGRHGEQTGRMLDALDLLITDVAPDAVVVYGDTNSTLAGALAASKLHVPVAHVEAGLRSFNRRMPEEINRVVCDHLSDWLFAPTRVAVENLAAEGITEGVHEVGDVMADAHALFSAAVDGGPPNVVPGITEAPFALATIHRAGNTDDPARLGALLEALSTVPWPVVLPMHPRTRSAVARHGLTPPGPPLHIIEPVGYIEMLGLLNHATCVLTDSGGLQKEAYLSGTPCITLREETEWVETVDAGWNRLVGNDPQAIEAAVANLPDRRRPRPVLYGDGRAAERIASCLKEGSTCPSKS